MDALHSPVPQAHATNEIWNPNAVANWSILFTPVFGSYLNMLNWKALGEQGLVEQTKRWFYTSVAVVLSTLVLALLFPRSETADLATKALALGYLLTWYIASARPQMKYVKERFGEDYPRRRWGRALLYAVGIALAYLASTFVLGLAASIGRGIAGAT